MPWWSSFGEDLEDNGSEFLSNVKTQNSTARETNQLKAGEGIKKHTHIIDYYSAIHKNGLEQLGWIYLQWV